MILRVALQERGLALRIGTRLDSDWPAPEGRVPPPPPFRCPPGHGGDTWGLWTGLFSFFRVLLWFPGILTMASPRTGSSVVPGSPDQGAVSTGSPARPPAVPDTDSELRPGPPAPAPPPHYTPDPELPSLPGNHADLYCTNRELLRGSLG